MKRADDIQERARIAAGWYKDIEKQTGISPRAFCIRVGRDTGQMSRWVNGDTVPTWNLIRKIDADILKVKAELKRH